MQACHEAGTEVARTAERLAEFDAVLGLEVTARQVLGAGEGYEGNLTLLIQGTERITQRWRECPVRVESQRAAADRRVRPRDRDRGPRLVVETAGVGDQRVGRVIPAAQEHQQKARAGGRRGIEA